MKILSISLLTLQLLTLNGCGDKDSGKKTEASTPAVLGNVSNLNAKLAKVLKDAEAGNVDAQINLGWIYSNGHGATKNFQEAMKWYRLAAAQGNSVAQLALGKMYSLGEGVSQDYVRAQMWFILAIDKGSSEAQQLVDIGDKHLTPAQIDEAKQLAQDCESSNYNKCG